MTSSDEKINDIDNKISEVDTEIQNMLATADSEWAWNKSLGRTIRINALTSQKSSLITEKLSLSVGELSKSSERLEHLTRLLIVLTFFLAGLTIFDLYYAHPSFGTYIYIIFALLVGMYAAGLLGVLIKNLIARLRKAWEWLFKKKMMVH